AIEFGYMVFALVWLISPISLPTEIVKLLLFNSLTASTKLFLLVVVKLANVPMRSANVLSFSPTLILNEETSINKSLIKLITYLLIIKYSVFVFVTPRSNREYQR